MRVFTDGAAKVTTLERNLPGKSFLYLMQPSSCRAPTGERQEKILVLQWYTYRIGSDKIGRIDASSIYNVNLDHLESCESIPLSGTRPASPLNVLAINGLINPTIEIAPGEVQRWRIIHGGWDQVQDLSIVDQNQNPTSDLQFQEIAHDGLATGSMDVRSPLRIAPGQRSDVLIQAPMIPEGTTATYYIMSPDQTNAAYVATIKVRGKAVAGMMLPEGSRLKTCRPFPPISSTELVPPTVSNATLEFAFKDPVPDPVQPYFYTINFRTFHQQQPEPIPLTLNTAQEWTITARVGDHPFHIHVNPFQIISYTAKCKDSVPQDDWRDTLFVQEGESYTIRSRYQDFAGDSVLHCHILDHEDQGMMMQIRLIDPNQPQAPGKSALGLQDASKPAPGLRLPDPQGRHHDLAEFAGRQVVLVFFQGIQCAHCTKELRDLVRDARGLSGSQAEIVAVSSRRIINSSQALEFIGVNAADKFHLLVDEEYRAFRDFGCYDGRPQHGLFLIDTAGVVRARYVGESPFSNIRQVVDRMRNLAESTPASSGVLLPEGSPSRYERGAR